MPAGRPKAREILLRVLYESEQSGEDPRDVLELALGRFRLTEDGRDYLVRIFDTQVERSAEIDERIVARLQNWRLERLSGVARAVLRLGAAELLAAPETDVPVVIDEALRLAERYGEESARSFVNGVLDALARDFRGESGGPARDEPRKGRA